MQATATGVVAIPQLPKTARGCHKFKDIHLPLISVPKLCQAGCNVNFSKSKVDVTSHSGEYLITGVMDPTRNLYVFPIPDHASETQAIVPSMHTAANAYVIETTKAFLQYLHATAGFRPYRFSRKLSQMVHTPHGRGSRPHKLMPSSRSPHTLPWGTCTSSSKVSVPQRIEVHGSQQ